MLCRRLEYMLLQTTASEEKTKMHVESCVEKMECHIYPLKDFNICIFGVRS